MLCGTVCESAPYSMPCSKASTMQAQGEVVSSILIVWDETTDGTWVGVLDGIVVGGVLV